MRNQAAVSKHAARSPAHMARETGKGEDAKGSYLARSEDEHVGLCRCIDWECWDYCLRCCFCIFRHLKVIVSDTGVMGTLILQIREEGGASNAVKESRRLQETYSRICVDISSVLILQHPQAIRNTAESHLANIAGIGGYGNCRYRTSRIRN
ncbi:uncharacterized protein EI97DRAFT_175619 [Westerdykella ornata]|uniref:Uncharacterized protein n=1 Tax=Westerdykella ornata TaxID=318751 RepID=A0A6A6JS72_WESOR|nr:uncharacterized protein EI97DRAFT_175619 [Westerdykella ornata]KAF2279412.1 hypothetical protein EI97DRAFT_175619 [Westerdykella ornata]